MIVERSREYVVNMGNYESVRFGARVTINSDELTIPEGLPVETFTEAFADGLLTDTLAAEVTYYSELSQTRDSFIHTVNADNESGN